MIDLEITADTCITKIQVMRTAYPTENTMKCRTCLATYYVQCERYKPVGEVIKNANGRNNQCQADQECR